MKYFVMMQNCYGTGNCIDDAESNARRAGCLGRKKMPRVVWMFDPEKTSNVHIDAMGFSIRYEGERPMMIENTADANAVKHWMENKR